MGNGFNAKTQRVKGATRQSAQLAGDKFFEEVVVHVMGRQTQTTETLHAGFVGSISVHKFSKRSSMRAFTLILAWLIGGNIAFGTDTNMPNVTGRQFSRFNGPEVKLGTVPVIKLVRDMAATPTEAAQIKQHIANLSKIDQPDFGLSATMTGTAFSPVAGSEQFSSGLLANHQIQTSDDVRALVAFGPKALPFLLVALNDNTPTKLTIRPMPDGGFGGLFFFNELWCNPTNSIEQNAIAALPKRDRHGERLKDYTVKMGDVCFTIMGQIVGRRYLAVRYQPTAIVIINSPVHDSELAKQVRAIWSSTNAAQSLLDSLLFDYSTEGVFNGESLDGWGVASDLQSQAAMRLLYYFPRETSGMIAKRLARLDVVSSGEILTNYMMLAVSNGVRAEDFVKAVAWSDVPAVKNEILNIFTRTTDNNVLLAALPGVYSSETNLIRARTGDFIDRLPTEEMGPYGQGYNLLVAFGQKLGDRAKPTFIHYLQNASMQRWRTMAKVLQKTQPQWAVELLSPALTDKREFGWNYALVPGQNEPRRLIRVCDEVAETISLSRPELKFVMAGEHADLDRQIAAMCEHIQKGK
jgi:hypothetical protein